MGKVSIFLKSQLSTIKRFWCGSGCKKKEFCINFDEILYTGSKDIVKT